MKKKNSNTIISVLLLALAVRLTMVFLSPLYPDKGQLPSYKDEPLHLHYVKYVSEHHRRPIVNPDLYEKDTLSHKFAQLPLYYYIAAPVYKFGQGFNTQIGGLISLRLLSVLLGLQAIYLTYLLGIKVSGDLKIALGAAIAIGFAPNSLVITSMVTNESLLLTLSVLALYLIIYFSKQKINPTNIFIASAATALVIWTKLIGLVFLPLLLFSVPSKTPFKSKLKVLLQALFVCLILLTPLLIWNMNSYGNPFSFQLKSYNSESNLTTTFGLSGKAIDQPALAAKIFLKTIAVPYFELWDSKADKVTSLAWLIWSVLILLIGLVVQVSNMSKYGASLSLLLSMGCVSLYYCVVSPYVDARLWIVAYAPIALLAGIGFNRIKVNHFIQMAIWMLPLIVGILFK